LSFLSNIKRTVKKCLKPVRDRLVNRTAQENDAIYRLIYHYVHDKDQALPLASLQTKNAFAHQWEKFPEGDALLGDVWFRNHVSQILCEEELQINSTWFAEKDVLDAGCGNGRWSYGFAQLGANITAVDINQVALNKTSQILEGFSVRKNFIQSPLENLTSNLQSKQFDLVFSWGVVHHCESFNQALDQLTQCVREGGMLYLYLYGRESLSFKEDINLFKERIIYNTLFSDEEKHAFLMKKTGGDIAKIHIAHDLYAPLINRRLEFDYVKNFLEKRNFYSIVRTIDSTEIFVRAFKGDAQLLQKEVLPKKVKPYWFERYL
jgi:2-polyprenyl-3-methyl-5-hydroxy-6-metoxy-1,4-benzoquinol methylase